MSDLLYTTFSYTAGFVVLNVFQTILILTNLLPVQMMMGRSSMQVAPPDRPRIAPGSHRISPVKFSPQTSPNSLGSPRISLTDLPKPSRRPPAFPLFHPHLPRISGPPESEIFSSRFLVVSDFGCRYRADRG